MMLSREKGNVNIDEEQHESKKIVKEIDDEPHLPQELIIENILTRLPARILGVFSCVSKVWCNLISNDSRFAAAHFFQNKNKYNLVFNLINVNQNNWENAYIFNLQKSSDGFDYKLLMALCIKNTIELVGYCNGLACVKGVSEDGEILGVVKIINPNRGETLNLPYFAPSGGSCRYLCHGFGFDSSSNAYKIVVIYASEDNDEFICLVVTLGINSWRTIVASTAEMSPPPGCSPFPRRMITRTLRDYQREATLCGGNLFWRITNNTSNDNDKIEMLLSFDIHDEKLQFIHLPTECTLVPMNEHHYVEVDHHLLEFKGYPCVARSEKIIKNNRYRRHRCNAQRGFCRCCFKVHLYILKDKLQQLWEKKESFDIQMEEGSVPVSFCCYCGTTANAAATTTTPPTRMLSFSDQVVLYWFNGTYLVFYNLQVKHFEVVNCCNEENRAVFEVKMKGIPERRRIGEDDHIYCPYMDYQLHAQVENILSLKTFIPEGGTCKLVDGYHGFQTYVEHNIPTGWLCTGKDRSTLKYYIYV